MHLADKSRSLTNISFASHVECMNQHHLQRVENSFELDTPRRKWVKCFFD